MSVSQTTLARMEQHVPIYPETTSVIVQRDGKGKIATKVSLLFSILLPLRFDKRYLPGSIGYVHMYALHYCYTYMEFSTVSRFLPSISWGVPSILLLPKYVPDWREALWQFIFESKNSARWLQPRLSPHHTFYLGVEPKYIICSWNGESLIPQKC